MISGVLELKESVTAYLDSHGICAQYEKAKRYIIAGHTELVDLKKRKPGKDGVYQFRITDKYRALARFTGSMLIVFAIDDHQ